MNEHRAQPDPTPVALADLQRGHRVRRALDAEHVERLSEVLDRCPPILLSGDGAIVDGEHRVAAARRLGLAELPAVILPGEPVPGTDLIRSIEANAAHGLPLTTEERRDAVTAVLAVRPELSDREVARICGVSRGVVLIVRAADCSGGSDGHLNGRVGADGKRYGTVPSRWRSHLEALLRAGPTMSVRDLAGHTGASVGAVQAHRRDLLARIAVEHRLLRWWRRLRARWYLQRSRNKIGSCAPSVGGFTRRRDRGAGGRARRGRAWRGR